MEYTLTLRPMVRHNNDYKFESYGMGGMLEKAGKMGGPVGSVAQFGSSITEMQDHISGLQKNLDTFKKVQASLPGK